MHDADEAGVPPRCTGFLENSMTVSAAAWKNKEQSSLWLA